MSFVLAFVGGVLFGAGLMGIFANIWALRITRFLSVDADFDEV